VDPSKYKTLLLTIINNVHVVAESINAIDETLIVPVLRVKKLIPLAAPAVDQKVPPEPFV
jgi:hypothetical protein